MRPRQILPEEAYEVYHDLQCRCGTPASALSCPLAVGIVGERCCQGCPDCMGIGVRQQLTGLTAQIEWLERRIAEVVAIPEEDYRGNDTAHNALLRRIKAMLTDSAYS